MFISDLYKIFLEHPLITTDSRDVPKGSMFFALKGDNFDGNQYAVPSLEKGASYAVVDNNEIYSNAPSGIKNRILLVDDVLSTLQQLANHHRCQLGTTIIGVTGTNGKTTTKELIAAVLSKKYNVLYTQGNFNNHIGVPKTLLRLTKEHQIAVVEMGANHPGEIKTLVNIVQPDYGIITNVGKAHLLGFGSFEGVIRTKGELYDYLREDKGTVFINNDNEHLKGISHDLNLIRYGQKGDGDLLVQGEFIECNPFLKFLWHSLSEEETKEFTIQTKLIGSYNIDNALAAACIGTFFAVPAQDICDAISEYTPSNNRSQLTLTKDNRLVVDAYNANPTSMNAALQNFRLMKADHKMCILGDMGELGEVSQDEHKKILALLRECAFEQVWLVGDEFKKALDSQLSTQPSLPVQEESEWGCRLSTFPNVDAVKAEIAKSKPTDKTILIKGSNYTKLYQVVEFL